MSLSRLFIIFDSNNFSQRAVDEIVPSFQDLGESRGGNIEGDVVLVDERVL